MNREKTISITLRGFDRTAQEVALLVNVKPTLLGNRGEPVRSTVKTLLTRSYVLYSLRFPEEYPLCEMLPALLAHLGGIEHLGDVNEQVQPEFCEFYLDLPVKTSQQSQEGYFSSTDLADVFRLKATISLGFF